MPAVALTDNEQHTLAHLLEGPMTRMSLGVKSRHIERLEELGFVKRAGFAKPKKGRPGILYRLTDKGRKRVR